MARIFIKENCRSCCFNFNLIKDYDNNDTYSEYLPLTPPPSL